MSASLFFVGNIFVEKLDILTGWVINIFLYTFSLGRDWDLSPIEIFILPRGDRILVFGWLLMFCTGVWIYSEHQPPIITVHFCSRRISWTADLKWTFFEPKCYRIPLIFNTKWVFSVKNYYITADSTHISIWHQKTF